MINGGLFEIAIEFVTLLRGEFLAPYRVAAAARAGDARRRADFVVAAAFGRGAFGNGKHITRLRILLILARFADFVERAQIRRCAVSNAARAAATTGATGTHCIALAVVMRTHLPRAISARAIGIARRAGRGAGR